MPETKRNHQLPKIAAIQLNTSDNLQANLDVARTQLTLAKERGADCAILPETFAWMGDDALGASNAELEGSGTVQQFLSECARELNLWVIGGSHRLKQNSEARFTNTTLVYNPAGKLTARYDKIHLFDAEVNDGAPYLESDTFKAGESLGIVDVGFAKIGLTICYDIRFPALYQALASQEVDIIVVPAAFTVPTGSAHWEPLLRARAIENQVYIIAPAQSGRHSNGRETWGHSLCIDAWGKVLSQKASGVGNIYCEFDRNQLTKLRQQMPVKRHQRPSCYQKH